MLNRVRNTKWSDKPLEQYEYILPRDVELVRKRICEISSHHAFYAMCNKDKIHRLSKSQLETAAKIACEDARDNTKAIQLTNDFDMFVEIAAPLYTKAYEKVKSILFSKNATFLSMKTEAELYGFEKAYLHIVNDIERYVKWGDGPLYYGSKPYAWLDK